MHLYSDNLSVIAKIYSLVMLETFPGCFSFNNNINLPQSSLGSDDTHFVFEKDSFF